MSQYHPMPEQCADTVPVKVNRVFDSCSDRDCFSNVQILMDGGELPANVTMVKSRCVRVSDICMNIEPVPFNRGFYSIDLTYTFRVELMAYERSCSSPVLLTGTAYTSKNVILYGGESNTKTFFSSGEQIGDTNACCETINLPTAAVQVVEPIALEARIGSVCGPDGAAPVRTVIMTLGLFSVVELFRPVTIPLRNAMRTRNPPVLCSIRFGFRRRSSHRQHFLAAPRANPAIAERPYSRTRTVHRKRRKRCFGSMSTLENGRQNCRPFDVSGRSYV